MRHIFAHNIYQYRKSTGLTQSEFAQSIGVTVQRLKAWEDGLCYPKISMLLKICDYIGTKDIYSLLTIKNESFAMH